MSAFVYNLDLPMHLPPSSTSPIWHSHLYLGAISSLLSIHRAPSGQGSGLQGPKIKYGLCPVCSKLDSMAKT